MKKTVWTIVVMLCMMLVCFTGCDSSDYKKAMELYENQQFTEARELFDKLGDYEDSVEMSKKCSYQEAILFFDAGDINKARESFSALGDFEDCAEKLNECDYKLGSDAFEKGDYEDAKAHFIALEGYLDSSDKVKECDYAVASGMIDEERYDEAVEVLESLQGYKDSESLLNKAQSEILKRDYGDVLSLLYNHTWFQNGGTSNALVGIEFSGVNAKITGSYVDGNGIHLNVLGSFPIAMDDSQITINEPDGDWVIKYQVKSGSVVLDNGAFMNEKEIDEKIQGYWKYRSTDYFWGKKGSNEYNIHIHDGKVESEDAATDVTGRYEYWYYGPYSGTYKIGFGEIVSSAFKNSEWFFGIKGNDVVVLHYDNECSRSDKLPGRNGYKF